MFDLFEEDGEWTFSKLGHLLKLSNIIIDYSIYYGLNGGLGECGGYLWVLGVSGACLTLLV